MFFYTLNIKIDVWIHEHINHDKDHTAAAESPAYKRKKYKKNLIFFIFSNATECKLDIKNQSIDGFLLHVLYVNTLDAIRR